jgi:hypothetical protein
MKDTLGLKFLYYKYEKGCFYISTNLNDFKKENTKINYAAVIEKILFTYPIGDETYLEGVFMLKEGSLLLFDKGKITNETYVSIDSCFAHQLPLKKFNKQMFLDIFEKSVLQRASVSSKLNVSLTGGFDGRSNVAVLLYHKKKFHSYSFGKQGGENTTVPLRVAKKMGLEYEPIYLDKDYEQNYDRCAFDAIFFSDGISDFERANYIYAMQNLTNYAQYNITGLIGGEIFAPVHLKTDYINSTYFDIVYCGLDFSINTLLTEKGINQFVNKEVTENKKTLQKILNHIEVQRIIIQNWKKDEFGWLYYIKDFMTLGFRKFYGTQMHIERYFNENLNPFYDLDLIEYIFSTRYIFLYQNAFKKSPLFRRNNRKLQTLIINFFSKELGSIPVDRGYPPFYTNSINKLLIPFIFYKRRLKLKHSAPEFDTPKWSKILYNELINNSSLFSSDLLNKDITMGAIKKYKSTDYNNSFNQMLSVAIWLKQ